MNNILITSAGQRVSLVRAFKNETNKFDSSLKVYTVDLKPALAPACYVSDGYRSVPRVTDNSYIGHLLQLCTEWNIGMIVPTIDTELSVLARNRERFTERGIHCIVSDVEFIKACRDKRIINRFFEDHGIEVPKEVDKSNPTYPLFIKPYDGSLSKDIAVIRSPNDFTEFHHDNPKLMFMEYLDPRLYTEFTVDSYYDKHGSLKCVVPRKRIFVRAGEINKGVTAKNELVAFIKNKLPKIPGARGCLTMQFFLSVESYRIVGIEINSRFGGGFPLSYLAGANYPRWLIEEYFMESELSYFEGWEDKLLMLRYDDEILVHNYDE